MNFEELKKICNDCEVFGEKLIIKTNLSSTIKFIKDNYKFDLLKEIVGIDNNDHIELIYRMYSTSNEEELIISTIVCDSAESVSRIFDSAVADEKEIYDLFGINFIGNNELKRLYMPENWSGHPLRKDYEEKDERLKWNE